VSASSQPATWVVGSGGLLGGAVAKALGSEGGLWSPTAAVPWATPDASTTLESMLQDFSAVVGAGPWQIAWCAGAGVTGSTAASFAAEEAVLERFLEALDRSTLRSDVGGFFLASSAGALYAGTPHPPFDEHSPTHPLSAYGDSKLRTENLVRRHHERSGLPIVIGRISNLYGPGQDISKPQGLISHLCRGTLQRKPLHLFVPLDTRRDYLYADDAGRLVCAMLDRLRAETATTGPAAHLKVMCSGQSVTTGFLLSEVGRIVKRRPTATFGTNAQTRLQSPDLRLVSVVWADLSQASRTPLPVGIDRVFDATRRHLLNGDTV
jgi:UDP-glucose 4-epimerase